MTNRLRLTTTALAYPSLLPSTASASSQSAMRAPMCQSKLSTRRGTFLDLSMIGERRYGGLVRSHYFQLGS